MNRFIVTILTCFWRLASLFFQVRTDGIERQYARKKGHTPSRPRATPSDLPSNKKDDPRPEGRQTPTQTTTAATSENAKKDQQPTLLNYCCTENKKGKGKTDMVLRNQTTSRLKHDEYQPQHTRCFLHASTPEPVVVAVVRVANKKTTSRKFNEFFHSLPLHLGRPENDKRGPTVSVPTTVVGQTQKLNASVQKIKKKN